MVFLSSFKSTFFILFLMVCACGNPTHDEKAKSEIAQVETDSLLPAPVIVAANRTGEYVRLLKGKKVGVVANQTSVIFLETRDKRVESRDQRQRPKDENEDGRRMTEDEGQNKDGRPMTDDGGEISENHKPDVLSGVSEQNRKGLEGGHEKPAPSAGRHQTTYTHLVDSLVSLNVDIKKVFAPEHGFRGEADAGEKVKDGVDAQTGIPLISLYGKNRKPSADQLKDLDVVLFDIQDVGVRFYTYIATLQLVMEACAENKVPIIVLDRPNPNANYVDGPTMEAANTGFLGMTEIPLVYGMTIGEYARMINEEKWLEGQNKANLTVVSLKNWNYDTEYHLPIRPSPNLPDDTSITLYPSLGLFEGTNVNAGRGTEFQFQRYGASFLDSTQYSFTYRPMPNFGAKHPKQEGKKCFGKDLSKMPRMQEVSLQWLIDAYTNAVDKTKVFNTEGFTKHAGTEKLQQQIEAGKTEEEIKTTWQVDLEKFRKVRGKYLMYGK